MSTTSLILTFRAGFHSMNEIDRFWLLNVFLSGNDLTIHDFPFWWCCAAGGLDLRKSRFPFLLMLPCGRPRSWQIRFFCCIYSIFYTLQNFFICLDLSIGSMLEGLGLKNAVWCTSQRFKWTSGALVMIIFGRFAYKLSSSL